ncbi:ATP-binding cassette domain-containing protein [Pacificispira sp.]|uniref:ATP-binding cassette domain-containing protein n=1 Tax=Pacificispira sp. TaxID=2888761 RepID=UPI003BAC3DAC
MTGSLPESEGLALRDASIALRGAPLFAPITLTVAPGRTATIMGPSGSGKSTLLSAICGTLDPVFALSGTVSLNGRALARLPAQYRRTGILFQDDLLFPHLSVGDNLAFGLPQGLPRSERRARIDSALSDAGLTGFAGRDPATLSGGQRARVACLRALLAEPEALLLDEPFSKLDADLRARFRQFVFEHAAGRGIPVLLVTHDPDDAASAGGEVILLRDI